MYGLEALAFQKMVNEISLADQLGRIPVSVLTHIANMQCYLMRHDSVKASRRALANTLGVSRDAIGKAVEACKAKGWLDTKEPERRSKYKEVYMWVLIPDDHLLRFIDVLADYVTNFLKLLSRLESSIPVGFGYSVVDNYMKTSAILIDRGQTSAKLLKDKLSSVEGFRPVGQNLGIGLQGGMPENWPTKPPLVGQKTGQLTPKSALVGQFSGQLGGPIPLEQALRESECKTSNEEITQNRKKVD